jgi:hypothetical protein
MTSSNKVMRRIQNFGRHAGNFTFYTMLSYLAVFSVNKKNGFFVCMR